MSKVKKSLFDQMKDDDWAIIIGKDGELRGVFMPEGDDEDEVPEAIVSIMENYYGIDFFDEGDYEYIDDDQPKTFH
jgi:hypothetical protein